MSIAISIAISIVISIVTCNHHRVYVTLIMWFTLGCTTFKSHFHHYPTISLVDFPMKNPFYRQSHQSS